MDWDVIAPMIVSIVLIVTVGGVILLRPIAKRLGALLDVMVLEKTRTPRKTTAALAKRWTRSTRGCHSSKNGRISPRG